MKKAFFTLLIGGCLLACNNDQSPQPATDVKTAPVTPGIDNVNGNIPDTTRAIRLEQPLPKDSSRLDDSAGGH